MQQLKGRKSSQVKSKIKPMISDISRKEALPAAEIKSKRLKVSFKLKDKSAQFFDYSKIVFAFFIITRVAAILFSLPCFTDVPTYFDSFIKGEVFGMRAYQNFNFEYPPLALLPIYFPKLILNEITTYYFSCYFMVFATLMFFADFYCLKACQFYCKERLSMKKEEIAYMSLLYTVFGLLLFKILYHRLDVIVALFFSLFLVFFQIKNTKPNCKFFLTAVLGFFYKIIPAFIMPAALILRAFAAKDSMARTIFKIFASVVLFLSCLEAIVFVIEFYTHEHFIDNMLFHYEREIQIESSYASIALLINLLAGKASSIFNGPGSWNIKESSDIENIVKNFGHFTFIAFWTALFSMLVYKKRIGGKIKITEENFLDASLVTVLLFLAFQPVLSMQFFVWLIPISAIWLAKNRSVKFLVIFSFLFFTSFAIFSIEYLALVREVPIMVVILALRNIVLIALACFMVARFFRKLYHQ